MIAHRFARLLHRLRGNASGVAMLEFALSMPFLLFAGMWGVELTNYAIINMRVSQLAQHIADNSSRIGDTALLDNRRIYEADIYDLLLGANIQGGTRLDLYEHGRVIISSVEEFNDGDHCKGGTCRGTGMADGEQFINWQRCMGVRNTLSDYGVEYATISGGVGPTGQKVNPLPGTPVIFVEVSYEYQPLVSERFVGSPVIKSIASYLVRDTRDLSDVYVRSASPPDGVADCSVNDNPFAAP